MVRLSLSAKWQPSARIAFLSELRSEDGDRVDPVCPLRAGAAMDEARARSPGWTHSAGVRVIRPPILRDGQSAHRLPARVPISDLAAARRDPLVRRRPAADARARLARELSGRGPTAAPGVPLINAYRWDTGVEGRWAPGPFDAAVAVTAGTLANPRVADDNGGRQVSGAIRLAPDPRTAARGVRLTRRIPHPPDRGSL